MSINCCLCGRFIGFKEFDEDKVVVDYNVEIIDLWGNLKEWEDIYHKSCGKKYGVIPYE